MGQLIGNAWIKAATPENFLSGFKVTGVWLFDRNVFADTSVPRGATVPWPPSLISQK